MTDAGEMYALRPLGIGEIFDRAISLYVRNFLALSSIVLIMLLPYAIVQFFMLPDQTAQLQQSIQILQHPGSAPTLPPGAELSAGRLGLLMLLLLFALVVTPFAITAVAVGVAQRYLGRRIELRACFGAALQRWPVIVGIIGMELLTLGAWYMVGVVAFTVVVLIGILFLTTVRILGIIVLALGGLAFVAYLFSFVVLAGIIMNFAFYAAAVERTGVVASFVNAFARVLNRQEIGKASLVGLALIVIEIGYGIFALVVTFFIGGVLHSSILQVVVSTLLSAAFTAFITVLLAVYYYDVRVRREGLDLQTGLEQLISAQA